MLIVDSLENYKGTSPTSVAIGRFDGLHLGHQRVIASAIEKEHALPAVFTFEQSPHGVLTGEMVYSLLTKEQKQSLISEMGIQLYVCPPFSSVREMLPEEFVLMLKEKLNVKHICCGFNFTFGKYGKGNAATLKEMCAKYDIEVTVVPPVESNGEPVSSTAIRQYISDGDIERANGMLGYKFFIDFPVISGDKRGRTLDYPTINQKIPPYFIHMKYGVYATKTLIDGKWYHSVSNVGVRPTVGSEYPRCETNIIGFDGDLYGESVRVQFHKFLRDEVRFSDTEELRNAIARDIEAALMLDY